MSEIKTPLHPKRPLPVGTKVRYHGSHPDHHGEYVITSIADEDMLRAMGRNPDTNYSVDRVGYELCPRGMERSYPNREYMLYYVRRQSFTPIDEDETVELDAAELWFEHEHGEFTEGPFCKQEMQEAFRAGQKSLIREADSAT